MLGLCAGLGLLAEALAGRRLPGPLLLPAGFAGLVAIGGLTTAPTALAPRTTLILVLLAITGFAVNLFRFPRKLPRRSVAISPAFLWPAGAALLVFLLYGAPVLASGEPGFAGYIKLDDTSTWLAFTDNVLAHGHSAAGLAPSSYEATVQINLTAGYPVGVFVPLAAGSELAGIDPAWSFQPYLALMAALMALVFFELARPVLRHPGWCAFAAAVAAPAPLLVGYAWWGGIKEVATALLAATLAAGLVTVDPPRPPRPGAGLAGFLRSNLALPVLSGAALIGVMGAGGAPWVAAILAGGAVAVAVARRRGAAGGSVAAWLIAGVALLAGIALLALPTLFASGRFFSPGQGPLTGAEEMGNLVAPLRLAQYAGPWPVGDFRLVPDSALLAAVLVGATLVAVGAGVLAALRNRAWGLLLAAGGIAAGSLAVWLAGSPWIQGKALATGTASFLLLAAVGIAWLIRSGSRPEGSPGLRALGAVLLIVPPGVVASNALAYSHSWLAPHGQLAELEQIGKRFAGQGPALMTEYQPYGVRHFLRTLDAEGSSELRRRQVPRRDGVESEKGAWSDTDELVLDPAREGLFTYRTLVLRRSPTRSRPPSPYGLVWSGDWYEVWQRPAGFDPGSVKVHVPLGEGVQPAAPVPCATVRRVAAAAGPDGRVVAAEREPNAIAGLDRYPADWVPDPAAGTLTPLSGGTATGRIEVPRTGSFRVWVGGSARGRISVSIAGVPAGSAAGRLNNNGQFIELDQVALAAGSQPVALGYDPGGPLRPATRDYPFGVGPVIIEPIRAARLVRVAPARATTALCGRILDWIEAIR